MTMPTRSGLTKHVLTAVARRQRLLQQGMPDAYVPAGTLELDGTFAVECPYSGLIRRPPENCLCCTTRMLMLEASVGARLRRVATSQPSLQHAVDATKALTQQLLASATTN